MEDVSSLIESALSSLVLDQVPNRIHPEEVLGVSSNLKEDGSYTFMLGVEVTAVAELPEGTVLRTIPAAKYAIFRAEGEMPYALIEKQESIKNDWLPTSGFTAAKTPRFELYGENAWEIENPIIDIYLSIQAS